MCCSAAYSGELFNVEKKEETKTIGIGLIRPDNFSLYGYKVQKDEYIKLIAKCVETFENRGYEVKLFTNGLVADQQIGLEIQEYIGKSILLERPQSSISLVKEISKFKAVMVSRMHAAIVAYSLDIPAICLSWNNKHFGFMEAAGVKHRAIYPKDFDASFICNVLEDAIEQGWPNKEKEDYRPTAKQSIKDICNLIKRGNAV